MLFDRVYRLLVGKKGEQKGLEITQLRITFDIKKSAKKNPNSGRITINNLTRETRTHFEKANTRVALYAGYKDDVGALMIFQGDVTHAYSNIDRPDTETIFELGDGYREMRDSTISVGYASGVDSKTIVKDVSESMGIPFTLPEDAPNRTWANGFSYYGSSRKLLDKVVSASNLEWSIQNGNVQVIEKRGVTTQQGIVISSRSGMIKSPVKVTQAKVEKAGDKSEVVPEKESDEGWRVTTLLMPTINPGDRVILESEVAEGIFRVQEISHKGDSHGGDWQSELTVINPNKPIEDNSGGKKGAKKGSNKTGLVGDMAENIDTGRFNR